MKKILIKILKLFGLYKVYSPPANVVANFININEASVQQLKTDIIQYYLKGQDLSLTDVQDDLKDHIDGRLKSFRKGHIPFLDNLVGLKNKDILEIGCGTGSSSVALAEQGANVLGLDIDAPSLRVAESRAKLYKLQDKIKFQLSNATELDRLYKPGQFDMVIFYASIEHMTHAERIVSLKAAWTVLKKGGVLSILGTPNRLWYFDDHTSFLPFYWWLPDDLAFAYSAFSNRRHFNDFYKKDLGDKNVETEFLRWGRGVSYHEIELAIKPMSHLKVMGDLQSFRRAPMTFIQRLSYRRSDEYKYKSILAKNGPAQLSPGFYEPYLDFALLKEE